MDFDNPKVYSDTSYYPSSPIVLFICPGQLVIILGSLSDTILQNWSVRVYSPPPPPPPPPGSTSCCSLRGGGAPVCK